MRSKVVTMYEHQIDMYTLSELDPGEWFTYEGGPFIMLKNDSVFEEHCQVLEVSTGKFYVLDCDTEVEMIDEVEVLIK